MDERIFGYNKGFPIPKWDLQHRLSITTPVGPELKDDATVFRINSTFMDVSEQPYLEHQWVGLAILPCFIGSTASYYFSYLFSLSLIHHEPELLSIFSTFLFFLIGTLFSYYLVKLGKDEYFSLTRRPIRFNRKEKIIYALRKRRYFSKTGRGDVVWEVPWNNKSIFCIHRNIRARGNPYHIRCYVLDEHDMVSRAFSIGRGWSNESGMEGLLSQWNYWCWYMNNGPKDLPLPPLYFSEHEDNLESFLFCLYEFSFQASLACRIIFLPFIFILTFFRILAKWTCRAPIWPREVEKVSIISPDDPYDQPTGNTPVGWAKTAVARNDGAYPSDPQRKLANWRGTPDGAANARLWAAEVPPMCDTSTLTSSWNP